MNDHESKSDREGERERENKGITKPIPNPYTSRPIISIARSSANAEIKAPIAYNIAATINSLRLPSAKNFIIFWNLDK